MSGNKNTQPMTPGFDGLMDLTGNDRIDIIDAALYGGIFAGANRGVSAVIDKASDSSELLKVMKARTAEKGSVAQKAAKALDKGASKAFVKSTDLLDAAVAGIRRQPATQKVIAQAGEARKVATAVGKTASAAGKSAGSAAKAAGASVKVTAKAGAKAAKPLAKPAARLAKPIAGAGAVVELAEGDVTGAGAELVDAGLLFAWPFGTVAVLGTMALTTTYGLATGQSDYIALGPAGLAEREISGD